MQFHPDKAVNDAEREEFHTIMQEINAEHKEVLVLLKYSALDKQKETIKENTEEPKSNIVKNFVSIFNLTDEQKDYFINQGRQALTMLYDNIIENNLRK